MSPRLIQFLKRLTAVALVLAVFLLVAPRLLTEVGVLGPTVEERIAQAAAAIEAARGYGATEELAAFAAARRELEASPAAHLAAKRPRDALARRPAGQ